MPHPRHLDESPIPKLPPTQVDSVWRDTRWLYGLDLFDSAFYWEAHEVWEELWHTLEKPEPDAQLIQGMIQLSACLLTSEMGRAAASTRLLTRALTKLESAKSPSHPAHADVAQAIQQAHQG
jgi:predicted metal-dependent hydrolase